MKILFIHALADPGAGGGAEVTLWTLMRAIRDLGHECVLLAASESPGLSRDVREGVTVYSAKLNNLYLPHYDRDRTRLQKLLWHALDSANPFMQRFLKDVVAAERPDVVSVHCLSGWSALAMRTLKGEGVPLVQVLHGYEYVCVKSSMYRRKKNCEGQCLGCRPFRLPHRGLSRNADAVVGVSRFILNRHLALGYFDGVPIKRVIHNARDPRALGVRESVVLPGGKGTNFGFLGRLDDSKGVHLLIDAFRLARIDNAKLLIAGTGKPAYVSELHRRAVGLDVEFLGRTAPQDLLARVHVLVVPSLWHEPLGMVVAEALVHGRPVIGSLRGGIPEMVVNGVNGLLFEPDGAMGLARAIARIATEEGAIALMSERARESSRRFIDVQAWAGSYVNLYEEIRENACGVVSIGLSHEG